MPTALELEKFRARRNMKLDLSDWTQLADSPLTTQQKEDWETYRQELRDLPENTEDVNNPEWPDGPS